MNNAQIREPTVERVLSVGSIQEDYYEFKNKNAIKRVSDPVSELYWTYYENYNHKKSTKADKNNPSIILLHGICGTAGCYFYLFNKLSELGFRCISAQYPEYETPYEWISGFSHFLEYLNLYKPCVFGSDLGGFLLQLFVQSYPNLLSSIILCNSYRKTDDFSISPAFREVYGNLYMLLPHVILKNLYIEYYICPKTEDINERVELREQYAKEFMACELDHISASDLGSRITLQLTCDYVYNKDLNGFSQEKILLIETINNNIPHNLKQDIKLWYSNSKVGYLKSGGDFPYLTRPDEIAIFIQVHMNNVKYSQESNYQLLINSLNTRDPNSVGDSITKVGNSITKVGNSITKVGSSVSDQTDDDFHDVDYDSDNSIINNFNKNYL
ncbi:Alpha/beta hydrolase family protein [Theileria parva strain Muguga]|uniref:Alpha/beta hydrolase family protein n=1 Tax=Theileria parva strain Muguga TaxID=333668 RepID=UPI001C6210D4|nr:Alpha/beta hydrolase family protein [Theileria parva strain Muguga]EAN31490.2 Alpha/beta hydrolase family protein [Theileria parva strain Muguga]